MDRREFIKVGAGAAALGLCGRSASALERPRPKYVLFLMTDQHRASAMGINDDPHALTPTLDGLARTGTVFDNAFCQHPLCVPSRTSFMLGRYSHSIGVWANKSKAPRDLESYTQVMRENSRTTACFGKLHIHGRNDLDWNTLRPWFKDYAAWAHEREPKSLEKHRVREGKTVWGQPSPYSKHAHEEWIVKGKTIDFMRKNVGTPWFIQCSMLRPHGPLTPPPEYWDRFKDHRFSLPSYPAGDLDDCHPFLKKHAVDVGTLSAEEKRKEIDRIKSYYACLAFVDDMFREVLEELDRLGIRDETLVIYIADHGEMRGAHHRWGKNNFFDEAVKVPMMFSMPGLVKPGVRSDALVELTDLFPTLMDVLGLQTPDTVQGESLLPVLTGRKTQHRRLAHSEAVYWGWGKATMQFDGRYKIIYEPKTDSCDMYDLSDDPREIHSVASAPAHKERIAEAVESLKAWSRQDTYQRRG